ncbi:hypothetical protein HN588_05760 [Candidatus Bathyarchaeota archaeon]|nr:hypothetical protein [Candidatus Bathyarchaeota archaeon]
MTWATPHIEKLAVGKTVKFRPSGHSMTGIVNHRQLVTVAPITDETVISKGSVVLCKVPGKDYLHLVKAVGSDGRYQISNARGKINGWTRHVFGIVTNVEE